MSVYMPGKAPGFCQHLNLYHLLNCPTLPITLQHTDVLFTMTEAELIELLINQIEPTDRLTLRRICMPIIRGNLKLELENCRGLLMQTEGGIYLLNQYGITALELSVDRMAKSFERRNLEVRFAE